MSLFKTKDWWRTGCGSEEYCEMSRLLVAPLFGAEKGDIIVVGSSGPERGILRIYCPSSQWVDEIKAPTGYKATDLMLETNLESEIIDVKAGNFTSVSRDLGLAVLTRVKLIVYGIKLSQESSEHGDRCILEAFHEHESFASTPYSLTIGPFGSAEGSDALCVYCVDGTLEFYRSAYRIFAYKLHDRLLPSIFAYDSRNDVFITLSSDWILECYRYQKIAEFSKKARVPLDTEGENVSPISGGRVEADWTYSLGEDFLLGIEIVNSSGFEVDIVVMTPNRLYCFRDNCTALKYSKRLDYNARCFRAYVTEPDGKLMVLVASDSGTVLLYEGTTLQWSAKLPFVPVAIATGHFRHLEGAIVVLSDVGELAACYLGTCPSVYVAPPVHRRNFNFQAALKELNVLREEAKNTPENPKLPILAVESELFIDIGVSKVLEACPVAETGEKQDTEKCNRTCRVSIELSTYTLLHDIEIDVKSAKPLVVSNPHHLISNLSDRQVFQTTIDMRGNRPLLSAEIIVTATYAAAADGNLRVLQKRASLPLRMFMRACPPENTASFTATIKSCEQRLVNFGELFPEFMGENAQRSSSNALGLVYTHTGSVVTIVAGTSTNRYRIQSNDPLSVTLVLEQLVARLQSRHPGSYVATIGQSHLQLVQSQIEAHFAIRQRVKRITNEIDLLTTQLRNIQMRFMSVFGEGNTRTMNATGLPILLQSTYRMINARLEELEAARAERDGASHDLQCALKILLLLLRLNGNDDKYAMLESAIGFEMLPRDDVDWEEVANVALGVLLYFISRKSENSETSGVKPILNWSKLETARDIAKLNKRVIHAVERVNKTTDIAEID